MGFDFKKWAFLLAFIGSTSTVLGAGKPQDDDFDRLDGKGASGVRVDVIEWEGNLEIHVYPAGKVAGLSLKLDKKDKNKPVMVIGYRFKSAPQAPLIRRAILGIPLNDKFNTYKDPSAGSEYDKFVISNQIQSNALVAFKLDPPPAQLYPEGHPNLLNPATKPAEVREPASATPDNFELEEGSIKSFSW